MKKVIIFAICMAFLGNISLSYARAEEIDKVEEVESFLEEDIQEFVEENQVILDAQKIEGVEVKEIKKMPSKFGLFWRSIREKVETTLTFNPVKKAEKRLKFAEERIRLAEHIAENAEGEKAQELAIKMSEKANEFILKIEENKDKILDRAKEKKGEIFENILKHKANRDVVLDKIEEKIPAKKLEKLNLIRENNKANDEKLKVILESKKLPEVIKEKIQIQFNNLSNRLEYQKEFVEENKELIEKAKEGDEEAKAELVEIKKEIKEELKETVDAVIAEKKVEKEKLVEQIKKNKRGVYDSFKQSMTERTKLIEQAKEGNEDVRAQLRSTNQKIIETKRNIIKKERAIRVNVSDKVKEVKKERLHPLIEKNRKVLEKLGINVDKLPRKMTPELERCFREKVGEERFKEVQTNSSTGSKGPNVFDFIKARSCINQ